MSLPFPSTVGILSEFNFPSFYCHIFSFYVNFTTSCFQSCSCPIFPSHFCLPVQLNKRKYVLQLVRNCLYVDWLTVIKHCKSVRLLPGPHFWGTRYTVVSRSRHFTAMSNKSSYFIKAGLYPEVDNFHFILYPPPLVLWVWVNSSYHLISLYHLIFLFCPTLGFFVNGWSNT